MLRPPENRSLQRLRSSRALSRRQPIEIITPYYLNSRQSSFPSLVRRREIAWISKEPRFAPKAAFDKLDHSTGAGDVQNPQSHVLNTSQAQALSNSESLPGRCLNSVAEVKAVVIAPRILFTAAIACDILPSF